MSKEFEEMKARIKPILARALGGEKMTDADKAVMAEWAQMIVPMRAEKAAKFALKPNMSRISLDVRDVLENNTNITYTSGYRRHLLSLARAAVFGAVKSDLTYAVAHKKTELEQDVGVKAERAQIREDNAAIRAKDDIAKAQKALDAIEASKKARAEKEKTEEERIAKLQARIAAGKAASPATPAKAKEKKQ